MFKEKSPGVKILWIWTFGTAAVLVTSVVKTRLREMEKLMNIEEETTRTGSTLIGASSESDGVFGEEES